MQQDRGMPEWAGMSYKQSRMLPVASEGGPEPGDRNTLW